MNKITINTVTLFFLAVAAQAADAPPVPKNGPESIVLKSSTMQVKFPHKMHQTVLKLDCNVCHNQDGNKKGAWGVLTAHNVCLKCHREKSRGIIDCRDCHKLKN